MRIGGNEVWDANSSLLKAGEKFTPMNFRFRKGTADAKDHPLAVAAAHAMGDEGGAVADYAINTDFVISRIDGDVEAFWQWPSAPFFELFIELFVEVRDLAGGDFEAAHLLHDFSDTASANAFDIHGGDGGFESPITARAFLKKGGAKRLGAVSNLWDGELKTADSGLERARLEAIAVAVALRTTLMRGDSEVLFAFDEHGCVDEDFSNSRKGVLKAIIKKKIDECLFGIRVVLFVHDWC